MLRTALCLWTALFGVAHIGVAQADVHIRAADVNGTHALQQATATAAIRNYLQSWESFSAAFEQNRVDLLNRDFIGAAKDKLTQTIQQQAAAGLRTSYRDRSHDIQVVFYSPEGLSLELIDDVTYDMQLIDHDNSSAATHVTARYVVLLSPTETKWRVRVFQAIPQ